VELTRRTENRTFFGGHDFRLLWVALLAGFAASALCLPFLLAQENGQPLGIQEPLESNPDSPVEVQPTSKDADIDRRLSRIMASTGWFDEIEVEVRDGVVFLDGKTTSDRYRTWAGELAGRTRDVVAVVNRIHIAEGSLWDFTPAIDGIRHMIQQTVRTLPTMGLALIILAASVTAAKAMTTAVKTVLAERFNSMILDVVARALGLLTFLFGLYLVLQVAGLTRLAGTIIGGTGIAGLVAGIAFRDILENYLASILISLRNPFRLGDVVDIGGHLGVVQRVTSRGTVLMDMDGNHIQIPNATVYKSIIQNYTANPYRRDCIEVGIGYDNDIAGVQRIALDVLKRHQAVLGDPEPLVLADRLGAATVNLKCYFWYDGAANNGLKVKSSLIRLVKATFQKHDITMPDEAREIVFPKGVPVQLTPESETVPEEKKPAPMLRLGDKEETSLEFTDAEGAAYSEADTIQKQAARSRNPEESPDLLSDDTRSESR
jgi:small-conductance mechanosensitive channel